MKALIVLVVVVALGASVGAIVVGGKTFDGTVVEKPYDAALKWSHSRHEKAELGWRMDMQRQGFSTGSNSLAVSLKEKDGTPLSDAAVLLTVSRPSTTDYDRQYPLKEPQKGVYTATPELPLYGHWNLSVSVTKDGHTVVFDEEIYADKKETTP